MGKCGRGLWALVRRVLMHAAAADYVLRWVLLRNAVLNEDST